MSFSIVKTNIINFMDNQLISGITLTIEEERISMLANSVLPDLISPIYDGTNFVIVFCDIGKWKLKRNDNFIDLVEGLNRPVKDLQEIVNGYPAELPQYIASLRERKIKIIEVNFTANFLAFHRSADVPSLSDSPTVICIDGQLQFGNMPHVSGHWTLALFRETYIPENNLD